MRFRNVTSERVIAPEVNAAVQVQARKQDSLAGMQLVAKIVAALIGSGILSEMTESDTIDLRSLRVGR